MNTRLLKAKRVEHGLRQIDLARKLHIAEKTMNKKTNYEKSTPPKGLRGGTGEI